MLDHYSKAEQLRAALCGLNCLLDLPPEYSNPSPDRAQAPLVPGCGRQFHRFNCIDSKSIAGLCYQPSFTMLKRHEVCDPVYLVNISRSGLQILHHEQLFPGEIFKVVLLDGSQRVVRTVWCRYVNPKCYRIGASFSIKDES